MKKFIFKFECQSWGQENNTLVQKIYTETKAIEARDMDFAKQILYAHIEQKYYPVLSKRVISMNEIKPQRGAPPYKEEL